MADTSKPIFVMGATGYIGGRLVADLLKKGYRVRAAGRSLAKIRNRAWAKHPNLEAVAVNVLHQDSLIQQTSGCGAGYFLIPSINPFGPGYTLDKQAAANMSHAAEKAGWSQLIFLCEMWDRSDQLGPFLNSRRDVEAVLRSGKTPVTALHTSIIIGCGNAAFDILHSLAHRFRFIVTQRWMRIACQPIALPDVIAYLGACLGQRQTYHRTFDIGGPQRMTFEELLQIFTAEAGLPRKRYISSPFPNTRLTSYWMHLLTPVPARLSYMLMERLRRQAVCREKDIRELFPRQLIAPRLAFRQFLESMNNREVETHWSDAGITPSADWLPEAGRQGGEREIYSDAREISVKATREEVWRSVTRIGGETGWYYGNWLWNLRGFIDCLVGGVGLRRGRRDPQELRPGDALDVWRAKIVDTPNRLMLVAEMKLPGKAILDFQLSDSEPGHVQLRQTAWFEAHGILGKLYWYGVLPMHGFIFKGMLEGIARATRLSYRHQLQVPLMIKIHNKVQHGELINISEGGCQVFCTKSYTNKKNLQIVLPEKEQTSIAVQLIGQYRVRNGYYLSLKFQENDSHLVDWLDQMTQEQSHR